MTIVETSVDDLFDKSMVRYCSYRLWYDVNRVEIFHTSLHPRQRRRVVVFILRVQIYYLLRSCRFSWRWFHMLPTCAKRSSFSSPQYWM